MRMSGWERVVVADVEGSVVGLRRDRSRPESVERSSPMWWILLWVAGSVVPVMPYAVGLVQQAAADTPYAYLIWIPIFGFCWAGLSLVRIGQYNDDAELNSISALALLAVVGALMVHGMYGDSAALFVGDNVGILLWPFWALGLSWLMFGVGTTKVLLRPLAYLFLAWTPLYTEVVNLTTNPLLSMSGASISFLTSFISWIRPMQSVAETWLVNSPQGWYPVQLVTACSGSDSFLAMLILLPVVLVVFEGKLSMKLILTGIAALITVPMNILRLYLLLGSLHIFGGNFTFGILHPMLGALLFILAIIVLALIGKLLHLRGRDIAATGNLHVPKLGRSVLFGIVAIVVTVLMFPLYGWASGSLAAPVTVNTNQISQLMPTLPGYNRVQIGDFNEAEPLGPGAYSIAYAYSNVRGTYMMGEDFLTYNIGDLQSYGVQNCLIFHGNTILAQKSFNISSGVPADAFIILLPGNTPTAPRTLYEEISFTYAINYKGQEAYIRSEFAAPLSSQLYSNTQIQSQASTLLTGQVAQLTRSLANVSLAGSQTGLYETFASSIHALSTKFI